MAEILSKRPQMGNKFAKGPQMGKFALLARSRNLLKDPNGQILYNCLVKLQTKFREDPTVNEV